VFSLRLLWMCSACSSLSSGICVASNCTGRLQCLAMACLRDALLQAFNRGKPFAHCSTVCQELHHTADCTIASHTLAYVDRSDIRALALVNMHCLSAHQACNLQNVASLLLYYGMLYQVHCSLQQHPHTACAVSSTNRCSPPRGLSLFVTELDHCVLLMAVLQVAEQCVAHTPLSWLWLCCSRVSTRCLGRQRNLRCCC
jgi:hypothetical protein